MRPSTVLVLAQAGGEGGVYEMPPIDVEGTTPDEVQDTPAAASRLTKEEIETLRPYTLRDALAFISGVRHIDDDVLGRRAGIGFHGAPARRSRKTLLLEDGVPINATSYIDPSAHYTPPPQRLESVDLLKGAGHVLHGPLNNHGIINFINKRPTLTPETTAELGIGQDPDSFKRHLMHTRTNGPVGLVFAYTVWMRTAPAPHTKLGRFGQEFNTIAVDYWKFAVSHDGQITDNLSILTDRGLRWSQTRSWLAPCRNSSMPIRRLNLFPARMA
ncbi:MAG: TonB-dependent receptor plug domain-containing protein [Gammaproteobacteria bacterium]